MKLHHQIPFLQYDNKTFLFCIDRQNSISVTSVGVRLLKKRLLGSGVSPFPVTFVEPLLDDETDVGVGETIGVGETDDNLREINPST